MNDSISRQAAMDVLRTCYDTETITYTNGNEYINYEQASELMEQLPSAEPERKKGKWIEDAETYYKAVNEKGGGVDEDTPFFTDDIACPECLAMFSTIDNESQRFVFCPNCGADMRGEKND